MCMCDVVCARGRERVYMTEDVMVRAAMVGAIAATKDA